jgi:hypothetical protein
VQVLSAEQLAMGMTRLLAADDDLVLDCPDAPMLPAWCAGAECGAAGHGHDTPAGC